jgi:NAD(P)-dependent dehydrogenase (short-subunit alcohol dehydrogenase family)
MITRLLNQQHIVVIGGSSGIGRAVAEIATQLGATVTITGLAAANTQAVAAQLGAGVGHAALDMADEEAINQFFDTLPTIDHVYVAGGSTKLGGVLDGPLASSLAAFDLRVAGSLRIVRAAVGKLNKGGSFTFTGGLSTDRPIAGAWVSGLGTAAAEQLARVLVMEFPGVRFNAISPGYTDTPMWDAVLGENKQAVLAEVGSKIPTGRVATPEEVASAVILMMANPSINAEVIHVDGGSRLI